MNLRSRPSPQARARPARPVCARCRRARLFVAGMLTAVAVVAMHAWGRDPATAASPNATRPAQAGAGAGAGAAMQVPVSISGVQLQLTVPPKAAGVAAAAASAAAALNTLSAKSAEAASAAAAAASAVSFPLPRSDAASTPLSAAAAAALANAVNQMVAAAAASASAPVARASGASGATGTPGPSAAASSSGSAAALPSIAAASRPSAAASGALPPGGVMWMKPRAADGARDLRLVYITVPLPSGRRGVTYPRRELVQGGRPPYRLLVEGMLPPGLQIDRAGVLSGTPTQAGNFSFTLTAEDESPTVMEAQQSYVLRIIDPTPPTARPKPRQEPPPPPSNSMTGLRQQDIDAALDLQANVPASYRLTADDVAALVPGAAPAESGASAPGDSAAASGQTAKEGDAPPAVAVTGGPPPAKEVPFSAPTAEQLKAILTPLIEIEYPTEALFRRALEARRCEYFVRHVMEIAAQRGQTVRPDCPRPQPVAPMVMRTSPLPVLAAGDPGPDLPVVRKPPDDQPATPSGRRRYGVDRSAASAPTPEPLKEDEVADLSQFYASLLNADNIKDIVQTARKLHPMTKAQALRWNSTGCDCSPNKNRNQVVGFANYWMSTPAPYPVNFRQFTRLQYMGAVLQNDGTLDLPPGLEGDASGFSAEAHRHRVQMDLVIYRREWRSLLALTDAQQSALIRNAVGKALAIVNQDRTDWQSRLRPLMLPGWREGHKVFNGLTVFFEDAPTDPVERGKFARFLWAFMDEMAKRMKAEKRPLDLNLVVPDLELGEPNGPYGFNKLKRFIVDTESVVDDQGRPQRVERLPDGDVGNHRSSGLHAYLLVLMGDPVDDSAIRLRDKVDREGDVPPMTNVDFLESMVPVLFHRVGEPTPDTTAEINRIGSNLAYMEWTFAGAAAWPLPQSAIGQGDTVTKALQQYFEKKEDQSSAVCAFVCPNRVPIRLLLEVLAVAELTGLAVYGWSCRVRRLGRPVQAALWIGLILTLAVAIAILSCDPSLAAWREANYLLYGVIALLVIGGVIATFKPKVETP